jgi:hypothetical protein
MRILIFLIVYCLISNLRAQLSYSARLLDMGEIEEAFEIKAEIIIQNNGPKNHFLLKADAESDVKVFTSKKTLKPGDTALLILSYFPEHGGIFNKKILLYTSANTKAEEIQFKGTLKYFKADDKLACYYFGKPKTTKQVKEVILKTEDPVTKRDNSVLIPKEPVEDKTPVAPKADTVESKLNILLPENDYKPNHILFLIDVSNSMKDSLKLPLLKLTLHQLIKDLRPIDRVTFITYADSIRILKESVSGLDQDELHSLTEQLKARGLTKGRQAILKSEDVLLRHYIHGGNNQIILATDGKFNFYSSDRQLFESKQNDKPIVLTTLAFGNDKEALRNLKEIANSGKGSFIHVKKKQHAYDLLLNEIKFRSKK